MGQTKIEWTSYQKPDGTVVPGYTFNPWLGCSKVSPACKNCYAEGWAKRTGLVQWGNQAERRQTTASYWREPLKWNRAAEQAGERRRVFCASLADVFEDRPELSAPREQLFNLIDMTRSLDWLLLTKRPENIQRLWPESFRDHLRCPNIWLGTTVENQEYADKRIAELRKIPARVRFLSIEPLLGPIDLSLDGIHWVIVGGESGPGARPMNPDWARDLRDQCRSAGVAFHFKQWGEWAWDDQLLCDGLAVEQAFPTSNGPVRAGKKAAGRLLDGREWNEFPEVA